MFSENVIVFHSCLREEMPEYGTQNSRLYQASHPLSEGLQTSQFQQWGCEDSPLKMAMTTFPPVLHNLQFAVVLQSGTESVNCQTYYCGVLSESALHVSNNEELMGRNERRGQISTKI